MKGDYYIEERICIKCGEVFKLQIDIDFLEFEEEECKMDTCSLYLIKERK